MICIRTISCIWTCCLLLSACAGRANPNQTIGHSHGDTVSAIGKHIWCIYQDSNNNYWFGSMGEGVFRYDGKTIVRYTKQHGLLHNRILNIQGDKQGHVLIATEEGVVVFDGLGFTTLPVSADSTWGLSEDDIWFESRPGKDGVYRYDGKALHFLKLPYYGLEDDFRKRFPNVPYSPYEVYRTYKDRDGNVWFGTSNLGPCRYDGKDFKWVVDSTLSLSPIRSITQDKTGNMWFGNSGYGVFIYSGGKVLNMTAEKRIGNTTGKTEAPVVSYMAMAADGSNFWIATYEAGVWKYDGDTGMHYPINIEGKQLQLYTVYKDRQGALWLGTNEDGVYRFDGNNFKPFTP